MRKRFSLVAVAIFVFMLSATARAEIFTAYLTGAQEVPPVATTATGYARITVNESTGALHFKVVFNGLTSAQNASHIHAPGAIGATVGVAINFGTVGGTSGTIEGDTTITPTQLAQLRAHLGYVNVHSVNFGAGEIRGQLGVERPVDYDGDGRTDAVNLKFPNIAPPGVAPIDWWGLLSTRGASFLGNWGDANTDFPAPGDYEGDGISDVAIYRTGPTIGSQNDYWILLSSDSTFRRIPWGINGDSTVQRDYDGDGKTDAAVYRPGASPTANAIWFIKFAAGSERQEPFGLTGDGVNNFDTPIPGDYDGDGKFDIAVYRFALGPSNTYIIKRSSDNVVTWERFGNFNSDYILPGDYDGDGKTDLCAARTGALSTSPLVWWIKRSSDGVVTSQTFGRTSDLPVQGDWDGDARTDLAVYRPGATAAAPSVYWIFRSFDLTPQAFVWGEGAHFSVNTFDIR